MNYRIVMACFKSRKIKKRLVQLIDQFALKGDIPEFRIEEIQEYLDQNEFTLTYEVLTESIYEFSQEILKEDYDKFVILANVDMLNIDEKRYLFLEKGIV